MAAGENGLLKEVKLFGLGHNAAMMDLYGAKGCILSIPPFPLWTLQEMYCAALISAII